MRDGSSFRNHSDGLRARDRERARRDRRTTAKTRATKENVHYLKNALESKLKYVQKPLQYTPQNRTSALGGLGSLTHTTWIRLNYLDTDIYTSLLQRRLRGTLPRDSH